MKHLSPIEWQMKRLHHQGKVISATVYRRAGLTFKEIGNRLSVTRQRAHQLYKEGEYKYRKD